MDGHEFNGSHPSSLKAANGLTDVVDVELSSGEDTVSQRPISVTEHQFDNVGHQSAYIYETSLWDDENYSESFKLEFEEGYGQDLSAIPERKSRGGRVQQMYARARHSWAVLQRRLDGWEENVRGLDSIAQLRRALEGLTTELEKVRDECGPLYNNIRTLKRDYDDLESLTTQYVREVRLFAIQTTYFVKDITEERDPDVSIEALIEVAEDVRCKMTDVVQQHEAVEQRFAMLEDERNHCMDKVTANIKTAEAFAIPIAAPYLAAKALIEQTENAASKVIMGAAGCVGGILATAFFVGAVPLALELRDKFKELKHRLENVEHQLSCVQNRVHQNQDTVKAVGTNLTELRSNLENYQVWSRGGIDELHVQPTLVTIITSAGALMKTCYKYEQQVASPI